MRSEHIMLAALAFLNFAMTGVVYCEARDPRLYYRGVALPMGLRGPSVF